MRDLPQQRSPQSVVFCNPVCSCRLYLDLTYQKRGASAPQRSKLLLCHSLPAQKICSSDFATKDSRYSHGSMSGSAANATLNGHSTN